MICTKLGSPPEAALESEKGDAGEPLHSARIQVLSRQSKHWQSDQNKEDGKVRHSSEHK